MSYPRVDRKESCENMYCSAPPKAGVSSNEKITREDLETEAMLLFYTAFRYTSYMPTIFRDKEGRELSTRQASQKIANRFASIWLEFVTGFLWWGVGEVPLHHVRRFFYRLSGVKIGSGSTLHMRVRLYNPRNIVIGKDTIVGERVVLDGREQLKIGDHVDIATGAMIFNSQHNIHSSGFEPIEAPVILEDYVFIGPNAILLPGVTIGRGAVVGAGAVVTKNVEPMCIVGGVPAKEIGKRQVEKLSYRLGRARWFQ